MPKVQVYAWIETDVDSFQGWNEDGSADGLCDWLADEFAMLDEIRLVACPERSLSSLLANDNDYAIQCLERQMELCGPFYGPM